jgi:hypothetical protein
VTIDEARQRLRALGLLIFAADDEEIFADEPGRTDPDGIAVARPVFKLVRDGDAWTLFLRRTSKSFATLREAVERAVTLYELRKRITRVPLRRVSVFADYTFDRDVLANPKVLPSGDSSFFARFA